MNFFIIYIILENSIYGLKFKILERNYFIKKLNCNIQKVAQHLQMQVAAIKKCHKYQKKIY